jgi:hypothetical protein
VRFQPVHFLGEHRVFRIRVDVEAIAPELALRPIAKPIPQAISVRKKTLLTAMEPIFANFSERALILQRNQLDFDSAIPRFESWRPSQ